MSYFRTRKNLTPLLAAIVYGLVALVTSVQEPVTASADCNVPPSVQVICTLAALWVMAMRGFGMSGGSGVELKYVAMSSAPNTMSELLVLD